MGHRVAFLTCSTLPAIAVDDSHGIDAFARVGIEIVGVPWDGPRATDAFDSFDAVVVRSCWNYHLHTAAFRNAIGALASRNVLLLNAPEVVLANLDKRYLRALEERGVSIPRTVWLEPGTPVELEELLGGAGMDEAVFKPTISLSAHRTFRVRRASAAALQPELDAILATTGALVQELVPQVMSEGEVSAIFFEGQYSHAVLKRPRAGDFRVQRDHGGSHRPCTPSAAFLREAREIVATAAPSVTFARVDGVDVGGRLVLMELELVDPVLFLADAPEAPARFAAAVQRAIECRALRH